MKNVWRYAYSCRHVTAAWTLCFGLAVITAQLPAKTPASVTKQAAASAPADAAACNLGKVLSSVVRVEVVMTSPASGRIEKARGSGSGAIISADGYIITNHHVAGKAERIVCRLTDGTEIKATRVGTDALADICVLKLDPEELREYGKPLTVAKFGNSDRLHTGDPVFALGSPGGLAQSVTKGIVSNERMMMPKMQWPMTFRLDGEEVGSLVQWIGHDAVIYGGNSGGPLVDCHGRIVGINEIGVASLAGAIPSNIAKETAEQLIHHGRVRRSWTGLEVQPRLELQNPEQHGVLVRCIIPNSPADTAGLKVGDLITKFNGIEVDCPRREDLPQFNHLVLSTPIGKRVAIEITRAGKKKTVFLTTIDRGAAQGDFVELKRWGVVVQNLTMRSALEKKRENTKGVLVQSVRAGGPTATAKPPLRGGDIIVAVNSQEVANIGELRRVAEKDDTKKGTEKLLVAFERNGQQLIAIIKPSGDPDDDNPRLAKKAWLPLGLQVVTRELAEAMALPQNVGVRVTKVYRRSGRAMAPLKVGDVILRLDGKRVRVTQTGDLREFWSTIRKYRIGSEITLDIFRNGKPLSLKTKLVSPPVPSSEQPKFKDSDFEFSARDVSFSDRDERQMMEAGGVIVTDVEKAGWASLAHLTIGDILVKVNDTPINNIAALKNVLADVKKRKVEHVYLFVRRGVHTMFLEVEPVWPSDNKGGTN